MPTTVQCSLVTVNWRGRKGMSNESSVNSSSGSPCPERNVEQRSEGSVAVEEITLLDTSLAVNLSSAGTQTENVPAEKFVLSSRGVLKKHVTIAETSPVSCMDTDSVAVVNEVEDLLMGGMEKIKGHLASLHRVEHSLRSQVLSLEEHLQSCCEQRDHYCELNRRLKEEKNELLQDLMSVSAEVEGLKRQLLKDHSSYEDHMNRIAADHRQRSLARRGASLWQRKVKNRRGKGNDRMDDLRAENARLKAELLTWQANAKDAFLRSAQTLNQEVITMFQDATARIMSFPQPVHLSQSLSSSAFPDSEKGEQDPAQPPPTEEDKENNMEEPTHRLNPRGDFSVKENVSHSSLTDHENNADSGKKQPRISLSVRCNNMRHLPVHPELRKVRDRSKTDYAPRSLQHESRMALEQLRAESRMSRLHSGHRKNVSPCSLTSIDPLHTDCPASHIHVCHCMPARKTDTCPYCSSLQTFNLSKGAELKRLHTSRTAGHTQPPFHRRQVLPQPETESVIIEKHILS